MPTGPSSTGCTTTAFFNANLHSLGIFVDLRMMQLGAEFLALTNDLFAPNHLPHH